MNHAKGAQGLVRAGLSASLPQCTVEPPVRLVYGWHIFSDAGDATEVEVRFVANGDGTTRVELEHRGWDAFDDGATRRERNRGQWRRLIPTYARACGGHRPAPARLHSMSSCWAVHRNDHCAQHLGMSRLV